MIKEGDRVKCRLNDIQVKAPVGTVEKIIDSVAIVRFSNGNAEKILLSDLVIVEDSVKLTREEFKQLTERVVIEALDEIGERDESGKPINRLFEVSAELAFSRLESLIFGGADND